MAQLLSNKGIFIAGALAANNEIPNDWVNCRIRNRGTSTANASVIFYRDNAKTLSMATAYILEAGEALDLNTGSATGYPIGITVPSGAIVDYLFTY